MRMRTDEPPEPPGEGPPRRKFYPPPPRAASDPIPLNYRDRREKQPRDRPPGSGGCMDLPLGLLLYFVSFAFYVSWRGPSFRHILEMAGAFVVLAVAVSIATRRWGITVGVVIAALLSLGGCGLLGTICGPSIWR